ncbi:hypothetical protein FHX62_002810 [Cupriavidus alkaliphilus]|nr:hypothetical protein [Cupriavidus alkaliphilus]
MTKSQQLKCMSALLVEVRAARRLAEREACKASDGNYTISLASVLEKHIRAAKGRRHLIWLACAAELGVLRRTHLQLNRPALEALDERALKALFWAVVRRWHRTQAAGPGLTEQITARRKWDGKPCRDCSDLNLDRRRYTPHRWLERDGLDGSLQADSDLPIRFRCVRCETHWVRRLIASEYFAWWSITRFGDALAKDAGEGSGHNGKAQV